MVTREEAAQLLVSQAPHFQLDDVEFSGIPMRVYVNAPRSLRSLLNSTASAWPDRLARAIGTHRNHLTNLCNTELNGAIELLIAGITPPGRGSFTSRL